ncbi:unnamed protein product [Spirodela intermedia]|uniref:Uncharacterized protein n=1 Tax=Spirodela intermedia TaxID=51605 RepID=A0A7I8JPP5_SPIIN|nr:unnamed protein product [Spirodela intermedia]CAA6672090.1 unnamed protein product [Spirodela intermedia]
MSKIRPKKKKKKRKKEHYTSKKKREKKWGKGGNEYVPNRSVGIEDQKQIENDHSPS